MGKQKEITINTFDRGMSNDLRSKDNRKFALASHFDAFSFPHKLVPRPGFATNTGTSTDIVKTLYVSRGTSFDLIGLDKNANNRCYIKYWNGTAWATRANMESASETRLKQYYLNIRSLLICLVIIILKELILMIARPLLLIT